MILLDTSFLIGLLVDDDPHNKNALKIFTDFDEDVIFRIPQDVIKEFITVITYKKSSSYAVHLFEFILQSDDFEIIHDDYSENYEDTIKLLKNLKPHKMSFTDCSLLAFKQAINCEVLTFDENLKKALQEIE